MDCTRSLSQAYKDCKRELSSTATLRASKIGRLFTTYTIIGGKDMLRYDCNIGYATLQISKVTKDQHWQ